ncbi:PREDICTED: uncharacterized protein LOC106808045 [Priapulus caudatus]|uniref:Uncharacterized protein LOC106808045 n=1 Tax=Priapulus caudatus TaxID=37621 RepID=A0ABM1E1L5_PRICU|nr:PREDICTED: uncharacterized protein LOC106808045 [Priapulus caudatus]
MSHQTRHQIATRKPQDAGAPPPAVAKSEQSAGAAQQVAAASPASNAPSGEQERLSLQYVMSAVLDNHSGALQAAKSTSEASGVMAPPSAPPLQAASQTVITSIQTVPSAYSVATHTMPAATVLTPGVQKLVRVVSAAGVSPQTQFVQAVAPPGGCIQQLLTVGGTQYLINANIPDGGQAASAPVISTGGSTVVVYTQAGGVAALPQTLVLQGQATGTALNTPPNVVYAQPTIVHSQPTIVHSQPTIVHSQPTIVHSQPTVVHAQPTIVHAQPTIVHAQPTIVHAQPSIIHAQPTVVHAQPSIIHGQPTVVHSQPTVVHAQPSIIHGQPTVVHSQPTVVHAQPTVIHAQPAIVHARPSIVHAQPAIVHARPSIVHAQPSVVHAQPTIVQPSTAILNAQSMIVNAHPLQPSAQRNLWEAIGVMKPAPQKTPVAMATSEDEQTWKESNGHVDDTGDDDAAPQPGGAAGVISNGDANLLMVTREQNCQ